MTTLFLIRHGLTALTGRTLYGRTEGIPLDDRGLAQAEHLVGRFTSIGLTAIYSSPLERCIQTVEPLARDHRLTIRPREDLLEMDAGSWTGRSLASLRRTKRWAEVQRSPSTFRFPEGESFTEALERTTTALEAIARRHKRGRIAVATHGDIVRIVMAHYAGAPLDGFQRTVVDTASVSVLHLGEAIPRVLLVNDTGGLERFGRDGTPAPWEISPRQQPTEHSTARPSTRPSARSADNGT